MAAAQKRFRPRAPESTVTAARDTVTVACKLPCGLIMREFAARQESELVLGGGSREVTMHRPTGRQVTILGTGARFGAPPPILIGGYRLTPNVPKDLWENWLAANRDSDLVRNHLVFAAPQERDVAAWSREHEAARSGLEGIDPNNPGARVRGIERLEKPK